MGFREESGEEIRGVIAFVGVGANLGDPAEGCRDALKKMGAIPGIRLLRASSFYRTKPVGPQDQPDFINAVAEIRTVLSPQRLLGVLKEIERGMGRGDGPKWGPRVIDLDILLYGQDVVLEEGLRIPHPELHKRAFVLIPLCEIASYVIHPEFGVSVRGLMDRLTDRDGVEKLAQSADGLGGAAGDPRNSDKDGEG